MDISTLRTTLILTWMIYFFSPFDLFPDHLLPGAAYLDDIILGVIFLRIYQNHKKRIEAAHSSENHKHEKRSNNHRQEYKKKQFNPYEILKIKPGASRDEVKKAFHQQSSRYHPDKVSHLGKEFQDLAHEKFVEIQRAYEILMKKFS